MITSTNGTVVVPDIDRANRRLAELGFQPLAPRKRPLRPVWAFGDTAHVPLTRQLTALVAVEDASLVAAFNWSAAVVNAGKGVYAATHGHTSGGSRNLLLHRLLLPPPRGLVVSLRDGNGLDCRRSNLRLASKTEARRPRPPHRNNTSGFKGVTLDHTTGRWQAQITANRRYRTLGTFGTREEAAVAYDKAARELHGDFARTNASLGLL